MSFNKISYARNRLSEARAAIGKIQLDPEFYGSFLIALVPVYDGISEAIAILEARRGEDRAAGGTHDSEID
jgi:hypothetical protein